MATNMKENGFETLIVRYRMAQSSADIMNVKSAGIGSCLCRR